MGFPGGSDDTEPACNAGDLGSILGLGRSPEEGNGNPLHYSCLENSTDREILAGYTPWGHKELNRTERLTLFKLNIGETSLQVSKERIVIRKTSSSFKKVKFEG